ncbi:hypothetical protein HOO54_10785 [Bacillus sp. WMMC1349]|uniref:hypothetical protein n=1 Tax=Bacillus sp. WMMC1349 TaxID=2736254 RepID=UPI0015546CAB|nr:hypothetical protein [Bacillus sp. WMMC1349]NPC92700.1 hypothetical protein [Bacillus sp. WMMC1349]
MYDYEPYQKDDWDYHEYHDYNPYQKEHDMKFYDTPCMKNSYEPCGRYHHYYDEHCGKCPEYGYDKPCHHYEPCEKYHEYDEKEEDIYYHEHYNKDFYEPCGNEHYKEDVYYHEHDKKGYDEPCRKYYEHEPCRKDCHRPCKRHHSPCKKHCSRHDKKRHHSFKKKNESWIM